MRRLSVLIAIAALTAIVLPATAMANFAIHGNYATDTDACAGCHRAHTSYSSVTWTDQLGNDQSALLIGDTTEVWEFCYVCHGADAPGADTNVEDGVYEGTLYGEPGGDLNGGGFGRPGFEDGTWSSTHMSTGSWGAFGGGITGMDVDSYDLGTGPEVQMGCGACHDPHGSANYRILKGSLAVGDYSVNVGGYSGPGLDPDPDGFVSSVETGFPTGGFRLHTAYPGYQPNYTTAKYAKGYNQPQMVSLDGTAGINPSKGMSGWCSGCHTQYSMYVSNPPVTPSRGATVAASFATTYAAGEWVGGPPSNLMVRHRHPMNVELNNYQGPDRDMLLGAIPSLEPTLPLAHGFNERGAAQTPQASDWIECLTCHRAHGTKATMTGFASEAGMESIVDETGFPTNPYVGNEVSALLRVNNRGVCEGCHNK